MDFGDRYPFIIKPRLGVKLGFFPFCIQHIFKLGEDSESLNPVSKDHIPDEISPGHNTIVFIGGPVAYQAIPERTLKTRGMLEDGEGPCDYASGGLLNINPIKIMDSEGALMTRVT